MFPTRLLALVALVTATVTVSPPTSGASAPSSVGWCSTTSAGPCIESVTRAGAAIAEGDPTWTVQALTDTVAAGQNLSFHVLKSGDHDLGSGELDKTWSITFRTGTLVPRVVTGKGRQVDVHRTAVGDGTYKVTVAAQPVTVSGQCDQSAWPWVCPEATDPTSTADNREWAALLDGQVSDYGEWADVEQREAMYGLDYWTNVAATSVPPEIVPDPATDESMLLIRMANRHHLADGTTVVKGRSELRIPNSFLKVAYGVPNPGLMTASSLVTTVSGGTAGSGTVNIYQEPSGTAMRVDIRDMTFSARTVRVKRGVIVPTRPRDVRAKRITAQRGRVAFAPSQPRGARVTGYLARCAVVNGTHVVRSSSNISPVVVRRLRSGRPYTCTVRATSTAGPGPWSLGVRLRARP